MRRANQRPEARCSNEQAGQGAGFRGGRLRQLRLRIAGLAFLIELVGVQRLFML